MIDTTFDPINLLIAILAGIFVVCLGVTGLIWGLRMFIIKKNRFGNSENSPVTLRIMVPRYKTEEEVKSDDNIQALRERIAVMETVFTAMAALKTPRGFLAWLKDEQEVMALEIVAHEKLITFYATVPKRYQNFFEEQLHAHFSNAFIEQVVDFNLFAPDSVVVGGVLKMKRESYLPIRTYKQIESDPLNGITNALSKVAEGDGLAIQYVMRPSHGGWRETARKVVRKMHEGLSFNEAKHGGGGGIFEGKEAKEKREQKQRDRKLSALEQKMLEAIEEKISKAAMDVNIRVIASASSATSAKLYLDNVLQAFAQYNFYEYGNSLTKVIPRRKKGLVEAFIYRSFKANEKVVLNIEELASLWHLPLPSSDTPNIRWLLAKTAPPPITIPSEGLHLGYNEFRGKRTEIHITDADRRRHMYVIGKTGAGKSEFIKNLVAQDILAGKGVAVIDPHGDLADGVLELIPKDRIDDVIYFNPSDIDRPMGLNMLEAPNESMKDFAVQEMINIFYMLFPPEMIGPMFEHNMRNYMLTLMSDLENPGTIVEIPRMIADEEFQKKWVAKVTDPVVRSFWEDEMAKTSDYHKSEMMGYLVSKVGRFVENEMMRNIIGQSKSAFNFREIMDSGKILLVNLSKGKTGEVNANLIGLILVAKLQMAAFTRADIPEPDRKDFYLYIDEFQNFITPSIATILSEARKYRLNLVMAHQYMGQLVKDGKTEIRDAVLGNVGSYFVARVGPEDVETLGKVYEPTFSGYDLMNTDMFTWNVKMIINNAQEKPFTMKAYPPVSGNRKVAEALKDISRLQYGRDKAAVEAEIAERAGLGAKQNREVKPLPLNNL